MCVGISLYIFVYIERETYTCRGGVRVYQSIAPGTTRKRTIEEVQQEMDTFVAAGKGGSATGGTIETPTKRLRSKTAPAAKAAPKSSSKKRGKPLITLKFQGVPKKEMAAFSLGDFRVYTDINRKVWRLKKNGERNDKAFAFHPKHGTSHDSWMRLMEAVNA